MFILLFNFKFMVINRNNKIYKLTNIYIHFIKGKLNINH